MIDSPTFLSVLTGSFSSPAAGNPTVAMIEAAYQHHGLDARHINCEVPSHLLGDAVRGARAMGWSRFNLSIPHKVAVIEHLDRLAESAQIIGAVNCLVRVGDELVGENADGQGFLSSLRTVRDPAGKAVVLLGAHPRPGRGWCAGRGPRRFRPTPTSWSTRPPSDYSGHAHQPGCDLHQALDRSRR